MKDKNILPKEDIFYELYKFNKLRYEKELHNAEFEIKLTGCELVDLFNAVEEFKTKHASIIPPYYTEHPINTILDTINKIFKAKQTGVICEENEARKLRILEFAEKLKYEVENLNKNY